MQVGVGDGHAEFFVDLAHTIGGRLTNVVVPADGDVGVVGAVEAVSDEGFLFDYRQSYPAAHRSLYGSRRAVP